VQIPEDYFCGDFYPLEELVSVKKINVIFFIAAMVYRRRER
jgi:hypothetical protein